MMIDNIHNNQTAHVMGTGGSPRSDAANKRLSDESDATLQVDYAHVIDQATQTGKAKTNAVQKARELLRSGQLTTLANIRSAADDIVRFGI